MSSESWVLNPRPNPRARIRLYCFPYAGAGASIFALWPTTLVPDIEVCPVQLPGREKRFKELPFTQLSVLVNALAKAGALGLTKPFAFFGHSMGALIAFELARELQKRGNPGPLHLFVSGRCAPQLSDPNPPTYSLPESELIRELRKLNGTPEFILQHDELMQLLIPVLRADLKMCETYEYSTQVPLECSISAYGGLRDPRVGRRELTAWQEQTCHSFTLQMFPGDHFFLHSSRTSLLKDISGHLQQYARLAPDSQGSLS